jgi:lambda repressor-like predicted transcriptional regulator
LSKDAAGLDTAERVSWWAEEASAALTHRDDAIREMRAEGAALRTIAEAAGLTHSAIAKILKRGTHE